MKKEKGTKKRFGAIAIEKGFINEKKLREAMDTQIKEEVSSQKRTLIGTILQALKYMTLPQIDEVMGAMPTTYVCPHCETPIVECPNCGTGLGGI